jgi:patatin-like phospholipase/acyl hydrolase
MTSIKDNSGVCVMETTLPPRFQILALSGGGFRGLYTAKVLADIEEEIKEPIARRFDLIAGTKVDPTVKTIIRRV